MICFLVADRFLFESYDYVCWESVANEHLIVTDCHTQQYKIVIFHFLCGLGKLQEIVGNNYHVSGVINPFSLSKSSTHKKIPIPQTAIKDVLSPSLKADSFISTGKSFF